MSGLRNLKKKRRIQIAVLTFVALGISSSLIGYAMRDGINFYRDPKAVVAAPPPSDEVFRMGGLVVEGSIIRGQGETVNFEVTDGVETLPVVYTGILPDLFEENQGMIGTGSFDGNTFVATEILAKHDESYMPKEVMDSLKESGVYVEPNADDVSY